MPLEGKITVCIGGNPNNLRKNINIGPNVQGTSHKNWPF